jgi:hypothetical protein
MAGLIERLGLLPPDAAFLELDYQDSMEARSSGSR